MSRSPLSFDDTQQQWSKSTGTVCWSGKQVSRIPVYQDFLVIRHRARIDEA